MKWGIKTDTGSTSWCPREREGEGGERVITLTQNRQRGEERQGQTSQVPCGPLVPWTPSLSLPSQQASQHASLSESLQLEGDNEQDQILGPRIRIIKTWWPFTLTNDFFKICSTMFFGCAVNTFQREL